MLKTTRDHNSKSTFVLNTKTVSMREEKRSGTRRYFSCFCDEFFRLNIPTKKTAREREGDKVFILFSFFDFSFFDFHFSVFGN